METAPPEPPVLRTKATSAKRGVVSTMQHACGQFLNPAEVCAVDAVRAVRCHGRSASGDARGRGILSGWETNPLRQGPGLGSTNSREAAVDETAQESTGCL